LLQALAVPRRRVLRRLRVPRTALRHRPAARSKPFGPRTEFEFRIEENPHAAAQ